MYKKLTDLAPEQIFLVQGTEIFFEKLIENISTKVINLEYLKLSRFSKEDAQTLVSFNLERGPGAWCLVYFDVKGVHHKQFCRHEYTLDHPFQLLEYDVCHLLPS